jgi:selenocysteine lyase/cysteine desulfurase
MDTTKIHLREKELIELIFSELSSIKNLHILAPDILTRLGVFSFYVDNIHHNLFTSLLNDHFGIQVRGGCSCAGTYGHFLLNVDLKMSKEITDKIDAGDLSMKPGWIRLSLHPTMTNDELIFITKAIKETILKAEEWKKDYCYNKHTNEFSHCNFLKRDNSGYANWFKLS